MINFTKDKNLLNEDKWPKVASVFVKGIPAEKDYNSGNSEEEKIEISQSWKNVAVLRATSDKQLEFYVGYSNMDNIIYLEYEFTSNLDFGMRIGGNDARFFVFPKDLSQKIKLKLVELTTEDNPVYADLILI